MRNFGLERCVLPKTKFCEQWMLYNYVKICVSVCHINTEKFAFVFLPLGSLLPDNFLTIQIHCIFSILKTTYQALQLEVPHQCT